MTCVSEESLLKAELGELTVNQVQAIDSHLVACSKCARVRAEIRAMTSALGHVPAPTQGDLFVDRVMAARPAAPPVVSRRLGIPFFAAAAALLLVAGSAMLVSGRWGAPKDTWTARGAKDRPPAHAPWSDVWVVRDGKLLAVSGQVLSPADRLAVRYANPSKQTYYLAVFAVDASGAVHWIFPEYVDDGTDPPSVPLPPTKAEQLLPQVVAPENPASGPLQVFTLISREPTSVKPIEGTLSKVPAATPAGRALAREYPGALIREWSCSWNAR